MAAITFPSKVDRWLYVVIVAAALAAVTAVVTAGMTQPSSLAVGVPSLLLGVGFPVWIVRTTRYVLADEELRVHSGPFTWRVPLRDVRAVRTTRNPLSSPALSLDRLRIDYGDDRSIMISPAERERFLEQLRSRVPTLRSDGSR